MATKQPKIYTEYDAERRAEEIAAVRLESMVAQISEMTQNTLALMQSNKSLWDDLQIARKGADRMTRAAICYEEIYSRLSDSAKAEYREIEKEVTKEYGFNK